MKQLENSALHVQNLRLKFPEESSLVFKDFSFHVSHGEKVLLLGPSGCGKSTLLQVLSGIIPHSLEVPLKYDTIHLPESWGFVFQDPDTQFCMPFVDEELAFVLENLNVPRENMDALIASALKQVGLELDDWHFPIQNLSQGMKQRLALASVLLLQPNVLFLDEPSALLDPNGTEQIWDAIKGVAENKTVIIVEHKIEQIANWVDRVVLFNEIGEKIADGAPATIFQKHKSELIKYGIWYPEVWEDYLNSSSYEVLMQQRTHQTHSLENHAAPPLLELEDFRGYRQKELKIHVPKAKVHAGDWIVILGQNGAGKTTLLLSLMQLLQATGNYRILGTPVPQSPGRKKQEIPPELTLVFQNPELQFITNTIREEIAFSLRKSNVPDTEIDAKISELLAQFHLNMNRERHPYQLSIGQKRRLSVASALPYGSNILLLDEPTFGQDARNTFAILEQLEQLRCQNTAIIMVTHDITIAHYFATEIWTVENGVLKNIKTVSQAETRGGEVPCC